MRWLAPLSLLVLALVGRPPPATAACVGLGCSCSVDADDFAFGLYNPFRATALDSRGDIRVTCSALVVGLAISYEIRLSTGLSASYSNRTMTLSPYTLSYNLYRDSGRTSIWGNGAGSAPSVTDSYLLNVLSITRTYSVFGRIPARQNVGAGTYTDGLIATVVF